ncbi:hypothetical protein AGLY_005447 [Aphis glycines]|uniref:Uncharacterized protein n=1 Tax=Aphis glycines TaxID=307491 RepID=A0A6G0TU00_APHGL|nr:hypothetical protein AGLY_005447 [Aphis glycines]
MKLTKSTPRAATYVANPSFNQRSVHHFMTPILHCAGRKIWYGHHVLFGQRKFFIEIIFIVLQYQWSSVFSKLCLIGCVFPGYYTELHFVVPTVRFNVCEIRYHYSIDITLCKLDLHGRLFHHLHITNRSSSKQGKARLASAGSNCVTANHLQNNIVIFLWCWRKKQDYKNVFFIIIITCALLYISTYSSPGLKFSVDLTYISSFFGSNVTLPTGTIFSPLLATTTLLVSMSKLFEWSTMVSVAAMQDRIKINTIIALKSDF